MNRTQRLALLPALRRFDVQCIEYDWDEREGNECNDNEHGGRGHIENSTRPSGNQVVDVESNRSNRDNDYQRQNDCTGSLGFKCIHVTQYTEHLAGTSAHWWFAFAFAFAFAPVVGPGSCLL